MSDPLNNATKTLHPLYHALGIVQQEVAKAALTGVYIASIRRMCSINILILASRHRAQPELTFHWPLLHRVQVYLRAGSRHPSSP